MAKKKRPSRGKKTSGGSTQRFANQASLEGYVRYNPQESALLQLAAEARSDAETTARDRVAAGNAIAQSARSTQKNLDKIYGQSAGEMTAREQRYRTDLANLGPAADQYKAGSYFTSTTSDKRLSSERASSLADLALRQTDAKASARWGADQARSAGTAEIRKIQDKLIGVRSERGAYETGRMADLLEAQRARAADLRKAREALAQSERGSQYGAGLDPDTGKPIPGGKLDPKAKKPKSNNATPTQNEDLQAAIAKARRYAAGLKEGGRSRSQAAGLLVQGRNAQDFFDRDAYRDLLAGKTVDGESAKDPKSGKVDKGLAKSIATTKLPAIPSFDELAASVALDLVYDGGISRRNRAKLHGPGGAGNPRHKLRDLGLPTDPPKPRPKAKPKPSLKKGASGTANVGRR